MTALIVIAVIALILAAVLLMPVKICGTYRAGGFRLWVMVLFFRFDILPKRESKAKSEGKAASSSEAEAPPSEAPPPVVEKEKPPKKAKPRKTEQKKERPSAPEPQNIPPAPEPAKNTGREANLGEAAGEEEAEKTEGFIDRFMKYYKMAEEFFGPARKALRLLLKIDELNVAVRVGTQDAAKTAVYTGMLWGVAGNLIGLLARFVTIKKKNVNIVPAYNETVLSAEGGGIIRTSLANIIGAAAIAAWAYLKYKLKNRRNKK